MKKKIELSIIIVNYNTKDYLVRCLSTIWKGKYHKSQIEVIVVDNASNDGSVQMLKHEKDIVVILNPKNTGFASANNIAIKKAKGDFLLLLNPDTELSSDTLNKTVSFIKSDKSIGILTCMIRLQNGDLDDACHRGYPTPWNAFCHFSGISALFPNSSIFNGYHLGYHNMKQIHEIDSCSGAFMLIRKVAGRSIGWLDEDYFWYGEDIDFCYRMQRKGWKIIYYPFVSILHYKGISSGIKRHTKALSSADSIIKISATKARFEVMRIFYNKHYTSVYPKFIKGLIMLGIKIKEKFHLKEHTNN
jgi:GT2 family glycosyltransferase